MPKNSAQKIVDQFVVDITEAIRGDVRQETAEEVQAKLQQFAVGFGVKPMKAKKAKKAKRKKAKKAAKKPTPRPCPVPGCTDAAYPRHQLVCKEHRDTLERGQILLHRDTADKPGGIWYKLGLGAYAKAERKAEQKAERKRAKAS